MEWGFGVRFVDISSKNDLGCAENGGNVLNVRFD